MRVESSSRIGRTVLPLLLCLLFAASALAEERPSVRILATGGTIAGTAESGTTSTYEPGRLSVEVLIDAVPELKELADVEGEQICNIASQDMSDEIWLILARRVNALLASDDVDGVVITHGTDTMEETAYFLHMVVKSEKPVVLTGAMRAATSLGADGPLNLYNAVAVAADPESRGRGVLVVINDDIQGARDVTKTHTTDVQTFRSPDCGLIGTVEYGTCRFLRRPRRRHTAATPFSIEDRGRLPRVDIIYAHANLRRDLIDAAVEAGADGLVIAGVGNGNMTGEAIAALGEAVQRGVAVVRSTRVGSGIVGRNVEIDDDALGFVASGDLNPQKARILLKLALTKTEDPTIIQRMFLAH